MEFIFEQAAYLHCKNCADQEQQDDLEVAVYENLIYIGCMRCAKEIVTYKLAPESEQKEGDRSA